MSLPRPYYSDDWATLYHGDAREILPLIQSDSADSVVTDPPYGVNKADWDAEFPTWWLDDAQRIAPVLSLMPGIWNIGRCPDRIGRLKYRWTLAAHLRNSMVRGALGYANWIPCMVYLADSTREWCVQFADWCAANGIRPRDLDEAAGTLATGERWTSRLARRSQIPAPDKWEKIRAAFNPPASLDLLVYSSYRVGDSGNTSESFAVGVEPKQDHPSPKPLDVTRWFLARTPGSRPGRLVVDPFAGSGTTLRAAKDLGQRSIGIELEERYCEVIAARLAQDCLNLGVVA